MPNVVGRITKSWPVATLSPPLRPSHRQNLPPPSINILEPTRIQFEISNFQFSIRNYAGRRRRARFNVLTF
jgi:hypothetical protein